MEVGPDELTANPAALAAIAAADQIVLGPGILFTSLMAVLLVPGIAQAWASSRARKVFVLNLIEQDGETLGMCGADHLAALSKLAAIGGPGTVISHRGDLVGPSDLSPVKVTEEETVSLGWHLVEGDLIDPLADWPEHEPMSLGQVLSGLD